MHLRKIIARLLHGSVAAMPSATSTATRTARAVVACRRTHGTPVCVSSNRCRFDDHSRFGAHNAVRSIEERCYRAGQVHHGELLRVGTNH